MSGPSNLLIHRGKAREAATVFWPTMTLQDSSPVLYASEYVDETMHATSFSTFLAKFHSEEINCDGSAAPLADFPKYFKYPTTRSTSRTEFGGGNRRCQTLLARTGWGPRRAGGGGHGTREHLFHTTMDLRIKRHLCRVTAVHLTHVFFHALTGAEPHAGV